MPRPASFSAPADSIFDRLHTLPEIGLSPREMECVRLRTEDLRYEEIARVLGLQTGTVGALLARAHGKIRKAVGAPRGVPHGVPDGLRLRPEAPE
jgi:predicted DNA-binding protein (UPF0251 family)